MESSSHTPEHRGRFPWLPLSATLVIATLWGWWSATAAPSDQGGVVRSQWFEDYDLASAKARESGRPILVNFTGSDWCGYCIRMREEIFDTGIFAAWAKEHVILLECDFPRTRQLPRVIAVQNEQLAERYEITGFPTIVMLDGQGRELGRVGYQRGGAAKWIESAEKTRRGVESSPSPKAGR